MKLANGLAAVVDALDQPTLSRYELNARREVDAPPPAMCISGANNPHSALLAANDDQPNLARFDRPHVAPGCVAIAPAKTSLPQE